MNGVSPIGWWSCFFIFLVKNDVEGRPRTLRGAGEQ